MHKSIREIEAMDADEFAEWRLYLAENPPLDFWRVWEMVGKLCAIIYNAAGPRMPRKPEFFMPDKRPRPPRKDK